jgi:uncharacterized protein with PhoU and TrkA domain
MNQERLLDMVVQLKDLSEMMIDLAYSALIYGSEEIADHVLMMEETIDKLHIEFELEVLDHAKIQPTKKVLGSIRFAVAAEQLADAACLMANIVKKGVRAHPIFQMAMERAEETIIATEVSETSVLRQRNLGDLGLEDDIGMKVIAVKRAGKWTYNPKDSFVFIPGDLLIARGYAEGREKLLELANPTHSESQQG